MFLFPLNANPFTEPIISEYAYVSFPGNDLNPVVVATSKELTKEDVVKYLKSLGMIFDNCRITCYARKKNSTNEKNS